MKMLTVENLLKLMGKNNYLRISPLPLAEKDRIGLIGVNGTGKSSLLKIVAGIDPADARGDCCRKRLFHCLSQPASGT